MGYVSIFLGLAVVIILMIRRWSPLMVGIVAAAVVIFMNGLPYGETMTTTFFDGFCTMFKSLFPLIQSGMRLPMRCLRKMPVRRASMYHVFLRWHWLPDYLHIAG